MVKARTTADIEKELETVKEAVNWYIKGRELNLLELQQEKNTGEYAVLALTNDGGKMLSRNKDGCQAIVVAYGTSQFFEIEASKI